MSAMSQMERKPFEGEMRDVMDGAGRWEINVHDHGLVALVDVMPRLVPAEKTADFAIVQAARVSYGWPICQRAGPPWPSLPAMRCW